MPRLHSDAATEAFCTTLVRETIVARVDDAVAGFMTRREDEILCLYVARDARCLGIGAALIGQAQRARPKLALWSFAENRAARRFYARNGFSETGGTSGDNEEGLPDIRLEWRRG